jgi:hypothetical protein
MPQASLKDLGAVLRMPQASLKDLGAVLRMPQASLKDLGAVLRMPQASLKDLGALSSTRGRQDKKEVSIQKTGVGRNNREMTGKCMLNLTCF